MTEYDIPVDTRVRGVTAKGAECQFDPDEVLRKEFEKDDAKEREQQEKYGKAPS